MRFAVIDALRVRQTILRLPRILTPCLRRGTLALSLPYQVTVDTMKAVR